MSHRRQRSAPCTTSGGTRVMCGQLCGKAAPRWLGTSGRHRSRAFDKFPLLLRTFPTEIAGSRMHLRRARKPPGCKSSWTPGWRWGIWFWTLQTGHSAPLWKDVLWHASLWLKELNDLKLSLYMFPLGISRSYQPVTDNLVKKKKKKAIFQLLLRNWLQRPFPQDSTW